MIRHAFRDFQMNMCGWEECAGWFRLYLHRPWIILSLQLSLMTMDYSIHLFTFKRHKYTAARSSEMPCCFVLNHSEIAPLSIVNSFWEMWKSIRLTLMTLERWHHDSWMKYIYNISVRFRIQNSTYVNTKTWTYIIGNETSKTSLKNGSEFSMFFQYMSSSWITPKTYIVLVRTRTSYICISVWHSTYECQFIALAEILANVGCRSRST